LLSPQPRVPIRAAAERATARLSRLCSEVMATADKSNLFRDICKPRGSIAPTTMLAIAILVLLGLVAGGFLLHSRLDKLHSRLDKLETDFAIAKGDVESTNERLM